MGNKLSELSKPIGISFKSDVALMKSGGMIHGQMTVWRAGYEIPVTMEGVYSQEYVSALQADIEYMRMRIKEMDLLFGKNLLAMRAAVIEAEHGDGHTAGMQWIFNTLFGPGEFAPENETDAQDYYNREAEKIDVEFSKCMDFFAALREAEKDKKNG